MRNLLYAVGYPHGTRDRHGHSRPWGPVWWLDHGVIGHDASYQTHSRFADWVEDFYRDVRHDCWPTVTTSTRSGMTRQDRPPRGNPILSDLRTLTNASALVAYEIMVYAVDAPSPPLLPGRCLVESSWRVREPARPGVRCKESRPSPRHQYRRRRSAPAENSR